MKNKKTWKEAFFKSPGPSSIKDSLLLSLKGLCMGSADIIPGVSGGTIALITGIYEQLLEAIDSFDAAFFKRLFKFQLKEALAGVHLRFILSLFLGIGIAIISLARLMNFLLLNHPVPTWSLFFGLIAASILVVGRTVKGWFGMPLVTFLLGTGVAYTVVGLIPVSTPEHLWFIFLSGLIAICAMILPGLSGAFLLLILGKYAFITGALKNPFTVQNLSVIAVFCSGCAVGLMGFSRFLSWLLARWHNLTLAFLTGLMAGSMRKIWPWKEVLETVTIRGKLHVLSDRNILPEAFNSQVTTAIGLAIVGFIAVIILEKVSNHSSS